MLQNNFCRVCWLDLWYPIWWEDGDSPSYDICPCCGTEFWYQDCNMKSIRRKRWIWFEENDWKWHDSKRRPAEWDKEKQLKQIPKEFS